MKFEEVLKIFENNDAISVGKNNDCYEFNIYKKSMVIPTIIINDLIYIMLRENRTLHISGYSGWIIDPIHPMFNINIKDIKTITIHPEV